MVEPDESSRRSYLTLEAAEPNSANKCEILISYDRMQVIGRRSMGHAKECAYIVPMILSEPAAIFEGLRLDEDEDRAAVGWRCYCGVPDRAFYADGTQRRPFPNQVYLVFVNVDRVAYNWRWEKADPDALTLPKDYSQRFRRRLQ